MFFLEGVMYAVVKAGGRQIKVSYGDEVRIDRVQADPGAAFRFDKVLMVASDDGIEVGRPFLEGVSIDAEVVEHGKAPKVIAFKKRRRKNYRRKIGFRARYTIVRVGDIHGIDGRWATALDDTDRPGEAVDAEPTVEMTPAEESPEE